MPEVESAESAFYADRAGQVTELGPRSLALLRRMVMLLEILTDYQTPDPGPTFETEAQQFGSPTNLGA